MTVSGKSVGSHRSFFRRYSFLTVFIILGLIIVLFVLIPLAKIVFFSNKTAIWQALIDPTTANSIFLTLYAALITTAVGVVLGVPLARV